MGDFHDLKMWEKAHALTLAVYEHTTAFPKEELYGLTSQMRRSAASISTNIAEGCGRGGDPELVRFLRIALGSASELEYQLLLARDLSHLDDTIYMRLRSDTLDVKRMLTALVQRLVSGPHKLRELAEGYRLETID